LEIYDSKAETRLLLSVKFLLQTDRANRQLFKRALMFAFPHSIFREIFGQTLAYRGIYQSLDNTERQMNFQSREQFRQQVKLFFFFDINQY